jgi:hypothetical protein
MPPPAKSQKFPESVKATASTRAPGMLLGEALPECHTYQTGAGKPPSSNIAGGSQSLSSIDTGLVRQIRTAHPCPFARVVPPEVIEDVVNSGRSVTVATEEPGIFRQRQSNLRTTTRVPGVLLLQLVSSDQQAPGWLARFERPIHWLGVGVGAGSVEMNEGRFRHRTLKQRARPSQSKPGWTTSCCSSF